MRSEYFFVLCSVKFQTKIGDVGGGLTEKQKSRNIFQGGMAGVQKRASSHKWPLIYCFFISSTKFDSPVKNTELGAVQ